MVACKTVTVFLEVGAAAPFYIVTYESDVATYESDVATYDDLDLLTSLATLVIVCVFDHTQPGGHEATSPLWFQSAFL